MAVAYKLKVAGAGGAAGRAGFGQLTGLDWASRA